MIIKLLKQSANLKTLLKKVMVKIKLERREKLAKTNYTIYYLELFRYLLLCCKSKTFIWQHLINF